MDAGKRINVPLLRSVTVKVLAELQANDITFRFSQIVGHTDRFALTGQKGTEKFNLVVDGQTAIQFAEEIRKGVVNA